MTFAPEAFRTERKRAAQFVEDMLKLTNDLRSITPEILKKNPTILPALRMCCCPPIARDRLIGLSGTVDSLVDSMEKNRCVPVRMGMRKLDEGLARLGETILKMVDVEIFPWVPENKSPSEVERSLAAGIIADRLCGAAADPIVRNAQERRQLEVIASWLEERGYEKAQAVRLENMTPGTFGFRVNVRVNREDGGSNNIPVDVAIRPQEAKEGELPILIEAKSAGDFTNVNKRRKEEAAKMQQLRPRTEKMSGMCFSSADILIQGILNTKLAKALIGSGNTELMNWASWTYEFSSSGNGTSPNVQQACDLAKTQEERNRLGQFATPTDLADAILEAGLSFP